MSYACMLHISTHSITNKSHLGEGLEAFPTRGNRHPLSHPNSKIVSRTTYFSSTADGRNSAGWSSSHTSFLFTSVFQRKTRIFSYKQLPCVKDMDGLMSREKKHEVFFWHQAQFSLAHWPFLYIAIFLWKLEKNYWHFCDSQGMKYFVTSTIDITVPSYEYWMFKKKKPEDLLEAFLWKRSTPAPKYKNNRKVGDAKKK